MSASSRASGGGVDRLEIVRPSRALDPLSLAVAGAPRLAREVDAADTAATRTIGQMVISRPQSIDELARQNRERELRQTARRARC